MSESLFVPDDNPSEVFNDDESNVRKTNSQNPSNNGVSSKEHTIEEYTTQEGATQNLNLEPIQAATSLNLKYQQEIVRQLICLLYTSPSPRD